MKKPTPVSSSSGSDRDSELLRLGERWREAVEQVALASRNDPEDPRTDELIGDMFNIVSQIQAQHASTLAGAAVKLRAGLYGAEVEADPDEGLDNNWLLVQQALVALEKTDSGSAQLTSRRGHNDAQTSSVKVVRDNTQLFTPEAARDAFAARSALWRRQCARARKDNKPCPPIPTEEEDDIWMRKHFRNFSRLKLRSLRDEFWPPEKSKRGPRGPRSRRN